MRFNNVCQPEAAGDQRLQASSSKAVDYESFPALQTVLFPDDGKQRIAAQDKILRECREQRKWRWFPSEGAVNKNGAAIAHCAGQSLDTPASDRVECKACALASGQAHYFLCKVLLLGHKHMLCSGLEQRVPLRAGTCRRYGHGSQAIDDLDCRKTDTAGCRRDYDRLALRKATNFD